MPRSSTLHLALLLPAILIVAALFLYPLGLSFVLAFSDAQTGQWTSSHLTRAFALYGGDIAFTLGVALLATILIAVLAIAIGGYLVLGKNRRLQACLRWLYRWPLFIPFVVAAQLMRTFLAKNGMLNNILIALDFIEPLQAVSLLDWRGIVVTFVWKQLPFAALLISGAMAASDPALIDAARNLGARRLRVLVEIVVPQVGATIGVALILSFVAILSTLSVPAMINAQSPTMITVDMAWRINAYADYGVANALGFVAYAMSACVAWFYLRQGVRQGGQPQ